MSTIPVIDIKQLKSFARADNDPKFIESCYEIGKAFEKIGFVYITNHGIDSGLINKAFLASRKFFDMPQAEKDKVATTKDRQQGYVCPGREIFDQNQDGTKASQEIRESYDVTTIAKDAIFPDELVPELRSHLTDLAKHTKQLGFTLLKALAVALDLKSDVFLDCHTRVLGEGNWSKIRSLYYPPIDDSIQVDEDAVRCGEHSDYGTVTFLFQDSVGGLEVKNVSGEWLEAEPVENAILVNVGDLLMFFSGGIYPATMHRVRMPRTQRDRRKIRQSIVFFFHPDGETMVQNLVGERLVQHFTSVTASNHVKKRFSQTFQF